MGTILYSLFYYLITIDILSIYIKFVSQAKTRVATRDETNDQAHHNR